MKFKKIFNRLGDAKTSFLLAFALPPSILLVAYFIAGLFPIGNLSLLTVDLNAQYIHYFIALKNTVFGPESIFYSWDRTLGGEFFGIIAYYLCSPFNVILLLFSGVAPGFSAAVVILLKVGASGFTLCYYLYKTEKCEPSALPIFSIMYALCAYVVVYSTNLMWLDGVIILPILVLAIERFIEKGSYKLYVFALTYALLTNYYIAFMLLIFTAIYYIYYNVVYDFPTKSATRVRLLRFFRSSLLFFFFTVLSLGLSAVMLLPAYNSLTFGKSDFSISDFSPRFLYSFLQVLAKMLPLTYDSVAYEGLPFIFCGVLALLLVPHFFLSVRYSARKKVGTGLLLMFVFLSFSVSTLDLLWHGFQAPNWYNHRYSFIFVFLICSIAAAAWGECKRFSTNITLAISLFITLIIFQIQLNSLLSGFFSIIISLSLLGIYLVLFILHSRGKLKKYLTQAICFVVCVEFLVSSSYLLIRYDEEIIFARSGRLEAHLQLYGEIVNKISESDGSFYRTEIVGSRYANDSLSLGLRGFTSSTSTLNASVISLMHDLGYHSVAHYTRYVTPNPTADSLLGLKYVIASAEFDNNFYLPTDINGEGETVVYQNPTALSLAYCVDSAIKEFDSSRYKNPFATANAMVSAMLGYEIEVYSPIKIKNINVSGVDSSVSSGEIYYQPISGVLPEATKTVTFTFTVPAGSQIYCNFPTEYYREMDIYVGDEFIGNFYDLDSDTIQYLGVHGGNVTVSLCWADELFRSMAFGTNYFYTFNADKLEVATAELAKSQLQITKFKGTKIVGNIDVDLPSAVFTSIPFDDDWAVYVNGSKVETYRVADSLLAFDVPDGRSDVVIKFSSKSFKFGFAVSLLSAATLAAYWFLQERRKSEK